MKSLEELKNKYEEIEIPAELEERVKQSVGRAKKRPGRRQPLKRWTISAAAAAALFVGSVNVSPGFARTFDNIPVLGSIVQVLTGERFTLEETTYHADLKTPEIQGLTNTDLQNSLNEQYLAENKALYEKFKEETGLLEKAGGGHAGIDTGYEVLTDTDQLLSIGRYEEVTAASAATMMHYDTIDKENGILLTLPSLFKDAGYVAVISDYLKAEMKRQMAHDDSLVYFIDGDDTADFRQIDRDQEFYITADHKLVLSFDEYEVAPGYMGVVTFEIPSEILKDQLVGDSYIR